MTNALQVNALPFQLIASLFSIISYIFPSLISVANAQQVFNNRCNACNGCAGSSREEKLNCFLRNFIEAKNKFGSSKFNDNGNSVNRSSEPTVSANEQKSECSQNSRNLKDKRSILIRSDGSMTATGVTLSFSQVIVDQLIQSQLIENLGDEIFIIYRESLEKKVSHLIFESGEECFLTLFKMEGPAIIINQSVIEDCYKIFLRDLRSDLLALFNDKKTSKENEDDKRLFFYYVLLSAQEEISKMIFGEYFIRDSNFIENYIN